MSVMVNYRSMRMYLFLGISLFFVSCQSEYPEVKTESGLSAINDSIQKRPGSNQDLGSEVLCDSVYPAKGYLIRLRPLNDHYNEDEEVRYFVFDFLRKIQGQEKSLFTDTLESTAQRIMFVDFNDDKIKDILIQNSSDVRSNWTYYLFLVNIETDKLIPVKGFNEIKNPNYLSEVGLIDNYVNSGTNWTSFYKLTGDSVVDLGVQIDDDPEQEVSYEIAYKKALKKLVDKKK